MNIQIFGKKKCFDTKKAERFFKERGIKYQFIDMKEKGMSKGEFRSVAEVNGGIESVKEAPEPVIYRKWCFKSILRFRLPCR